jgi:hypothetical protein
MRKNQKKGLWIPKSILELNLDGDNKILLSEISSLCNTKDGCFASNNHFTELLGYKNRSTASKRISMLVEKGYITTENVYKNKLCIGRFIFRTSLLKMLIGIVPRKGEGGVQEKEGVVPKDTLGNSLENPINKFINSNNIKTDTSINTGIESLNQESASDIKSNRLKPRVMTMYEYYKKLCSTHKCNTTFHS